MKFCNVLFCSVLIATLAGRSYSQDAGKKSNDSLAVMVETSRAFRAAVQKFRPSLVTIESFGGVGAVQGRIGGIRKQGEGNTTGILISKDGYIITSSFNFIQSPPVITIKTFDRERRVAKLLGRDETRKICLLKIAPFDGIVVPEFVDEKEIEVGQWAIAAGVGYGDVNPAVSTGIISAKNRIGGRAIQTDANISPANYGGPLLDIEGRLIGVCVPLNPQSQAAGAGVEWYDSGIGFAIGLASLEKQIERMKSGENIFPAFLGVRTEASPTGVGVRVAEVIVGSAAADGGLMGGDTILTINNVIVNDLLELRKVLNRFEAGLEIAIEFESNLEQKTKLAKVTLGKPPAPKGEVSPMEPPKIR